MPARKACSRSLNERSALLILAHARIARAGRSNVSQSSDSMLDQHDDIRKHATTHACNGVIVMLLTARERASTTSYNHIRKSYL